MNRNESPLPHPHAPPPPPPPISAEERVNLNLQPGYYVLDPTSTTDEQSMSFSITSRDPESKLPPSLDEWEEIVTIEIGGPSIRGSRKYYVHPSRLIEESRFFKACLNTRNNMQEARTRVVKMPEVKPEVFAYFIQWIYNGSLSHEGVDFDAEPDKDATTIESEPRKEIGFFHLVKLWKLAGFLQAERLRNEIVDEVARLACKHNAVFGPEDTQTLWNDDENETRGLKLLIVDLFVGMNTKKLVKEVEDSWNERFLREVVAKLKDKLDAVPGVPYVKAWKDATLRCATYHTHTDTKRCEKWIQDL